MKRLSTRCMYKFGNIRRNTPRQGKTEPRKQTLDFLSQFARVYKAEPGLEQNICSYVLN